MRHIHKNIAQQSKECKEDYRDRIEVLRRRVNLLAGRDRLLMTMYLENGNSFRQIARLTGYNAASVARKIHRLTKRLIDGEYITCLRNRDKFTQAEMKIAKDYFLIGTSMRKIAARRHYSYYRVRRIMKRIRKFVDEIEKTKVWSD